MTVNRLVFAEFLLHVHLGVTPYVCTSMNFVFKFSLCCTFPALANWTVIIKMPKHKMVGYCVL